MPKRKLILSHCEVISRSARKGGEATKTSPSKGLFLFLGLTQANLPTGEASCSVCLSAILALPPYGTHSMYFSIHFRLRSAAAHPNWLECEL